MCRASSPWFGATRKSSWWLGWRRCCRGRSHSAWSPTWGERTARRRSRFTMLSNSTVRASATTACLLPGQPGRKELIFNIFYSISLVSNSTVRASATTACLLPGQPGRKELIFNIFYSISLMSNSTVRALATTACLLPGQPGRKELMVVVFFPSALCQTVLLPFLHRHQLLPAPFFLFFGTLVLWRLWCF